MNIVIAKYGKRIRRRRSSTNISSIAGWREGRCVFGGGVFASGNNIFPNLTGQRKNRDSLHRGITITIHDRR
ncbi:hypothetical protein DRQ36_05460 [bacterium]|nr:MAG: hypothetical protein DRQ36_05460 [bacterium]